MVALSPSHPHKKGGTGEGTREACDRIPITAMPYKVEQQGDDWIVINTETDEVKAHHETKEDAERQVRLLHELEKEGEDEH